MRKIVISAISLVTVLTGLAGTLGAQVSLNRIPSRAVGQPQLTVATRNPNLVEGREFYGPHATALDNSVNPPVLYVSDTLNNRVLGWRSGIAFSNGAKADFVIGQKDFFSTGRLGPGTAFNSGLNLPTGITVDRNGNLYVVDTGNNRIVRFPRPYAQTDQLPNLVIGQTSLSCSTCNLPNSGGLSAKTIFVGNNGVTLTTTIIFDAQGNLWFTDAGNNRVLRYPASALGENASNAPAADLVLGQLNFDTNTSPAATLEGLKRTDALYQPQGLAFDPSGRLYVSDSPPFNRVLVYQPNLSPQTFDNGRPALRIMGLPPPRTGTAPVPLINEVQFINPTGLFMIGRQPGVVDSYQHRILLFDPYELWPSDISLSPRAIASTGPTGQFGYSANKPNRDLPEPRNNSFSFPSTALVVSNELYVVDSGNNRLVVYSSNSLGQNASALRVLGQDGFEFGAANLLEGREVNFSPTNNAADGGIWIDTTSDVPHLYIADTYNNRVLGYRDVRQVRPGDRADLVIGQPDFQRSVINYPSNDRERPNAQGLYNPVGLAVDSEGNLFVADAGNGRVVRFPKPFDQPRLNFPTADLVLGQSSLTATKVIDPTQRTMRSPYGLAFTSDGALLVSDSVLNRVLLFQNKPQPFTDGMAASKVFGQPDYGSFAFGADTNQMSAPKHIATDSDDRIYVADENNARLLIFDNVVFAPSANVRAGTILEGPNKDTRFAGIRGIFVSKSTGEFWTTEVNAARVLRFPKFDDLPFRQSAFDFQIASNNGVAVTQDNFGDLFVAEFTNRVAIYYPGLTAVNAANPIKDVSGRGRPLAPGAIVMASRSGARFANEITVADPANWPMELSDIQVLVDDSPAPIRDVKIDELNFLMPMSAPPGGTVELQVVRKSTGQILGAGPVDMAVASPALFTEGPVGTGIGQIMSNNDDGSRNQPSNPIGRGKVISLFGTGVGFVPGAPPDGQAPAAPVPAPQGLRIFMGSRFIEDATDCKGSPCIVFSGLAPGQVGIWQIDVKVPDFVAPSPLVPVVVQLRSINSVQPGQQTTIAVSQQ